MKTTFFGLTSFQKSMEIQSQAFGLVQSSGFPVVLGFEYYPVITLGKRAHAEGELLWRRDELQDRGIDVIETDRGGQATLHSPGQLVIYPLVPIRRLQISVRDFVALLEEATIQWLARFQIKSFRKEDAGVFTEKGKIAFIGIRVEKGITKHGISVNISNDFLLFNGIKACGQARRKLDSLFEQGVEVDLREAFSQWNLYFTNELLAKARSPQV